MALAEGGRGTGRARHTDGSDRHWTFRDGGKDALEGKRPQRRPQKRLDRRSEEVAKAVARLALGVRKTLAGHRLGALKGDVAVYSPIPHPFAAPPPPLLRRGMPVCSPPPQDKEVPR